MIRLDITIVYYSFIAIFIVFSIVFYKLKKFECMLNSQDFQQISQIPKIGEQNSELLGLLKTHNNTIEEIRYSQLLHDTIKDSLWLKNKSFSPNLGAANYSFLYILFRILEETTPNAILEMGLGQTTKITSQYAKHKNPKAILDVIEHDQNWIEIYSKKLDKSPNTDIYQLDLTPFEYNNTHNDKYANLESVVSNKTYDLIIIDGPYGFDRLYPRTNILDLIPNNLSSDFIIILDDAERDGEINTANLIFEKLDANGIKYCKSYKTALKTQLIIASEKFSFVNCF